MDIDTELPNNRLPINAKMTDSNDGPVEDIVNLYMNIFLGRSGKKHKARHAKGKGKKKKFKAREVSESVDNLATASRECASVLCSRDKGVMTIFGVRK